MRLLILENSQLRRTLKAGPGDLAIGSSTECFVHLPDARISPRQAALSQDEDGAWWLDVLDSGSVPTSLNRAVQKGRAKLRHADEIGLGNWCIRLMMESEASREEMLRQRMLAVTKQHGEGLPLSTIVYRGEHPITLPREQIEQMAILALRLSNMETVKDMLTPILRAVLRDFSGRRAWIGVRAPDQREFQWMSGLAAGGQVCDRPAFSAGMQTRVLTNGHYLCCPDAPQHGIRSAMAAPLASASGTIGMLYVENDAGDLPFGDSHLHGLIAVASCVAIPLENAIRRTLARRQTAASVEGTLTRVTQDLLTPKALPRWPELHVAAYRHMGAARCCDLWDVVQLPDKTAALLVARVGMSGLSVPRFLTEVRSAFRIAALHNEPPNILCRALNWLVHDGEEKYCIDLACAWIAPATGLVQFCAAGPGALVGRLDDDGGVTWVGLSHGEPIGRQRGSAYEVEKFTLEPQQSLLLATDGVSLAKNQDGTALGRTGLQEIIEDCAGNAPGQVLSEFASELTDYVSGGSCPDDVTVLLAKRIG